MKSHLALQATTGTLALKPDASITVTEKNPMFNDVEMFSTPFELPFDGNRHLAKNIDDVNSALRAQDIEGETVRIIADGLPLRTTVMKVQEDVVLDRALAVNLDATRRTFKDMIQDMKCREVPVKDRLLIGEKIGMVNASLTYEYHVRWYDEEGHADMDVEGLRRRDTGTTEDFVVNGSFDPQALGFSYPGVCYTEADGYTALPNDEGASEKTYPDGNTVKIPKVRTSYINVSHAYGETDEACPYDGRTWPFFNSRICYTHYDKEKDGSEDGVYKTSDSVVVAKNGTYTYEDYGPYWVLDANRPASGICFYVLYFLDCLFKHLDVAWDNSELLEIEDMKHLAFFTTQCKYISEQKSGSSLSNINAINSWLESRGCGGQLTFDNAEEHEVDEIKIPRINVNGDLVYETIRVGDVDEGVISSIKITPKIKSSSASAVVMNMYASSDNFPDMSVTELIESLENAFGIRFCYNPETNKVTAKLLRKMFRQVSSNGNLMQPVKFNGIVTQIHKKTEKITGVRVRYSAESDDYEQREYVRTGKRDYDTDFDYTEYPNDGRTVVNKKYSQIFTNRASDDMNVYVDLQTGNAYRIKVSADATDASELNPAIFEVGAYKGVEEGDCSKDNEDYIKELSIGFTPVALNDVNYYREAGVVGTPTTVTTSAGTTVDMSTEPNGSFQPMLVPFIDEDMEHEFLPKKLRSVMSSPVGDFYLAEVLTLAESYDPTKTDDGNSPLQSHDWGSSIIMMRGGGSDALIQNYDYNYDFMGNSKWRSIAGMYSVGNDTMDNFGNEYDYNGSQGGIGGGERFSLKPRAFKPFLYYIDRSGIVHTTSYDSSLIGQRANPDDPPGHDYYWMIPCIADEYTGNILTKRIRSRGFVDVFLPELIHFYLERQRYEVKALCTAAELADIPNHWLRRYEVDGKIGWFNQYEYTVNEETGIGEVTFDFFAL